MKAKKPKKKFQRKGRHLSEFVGGTGSVCVCVKADSLYDKAAKCWVDYFCTHHSSGFALLK